MRTAVFTTNESSLIQSGFIRFAVDMKFHIHTHIHRFYVDIHGYIHVPLSSLYIHGSDIHIYGKPGFLLGCRNCNSVILIIYFVLITSVYESCISQESNNSVSYR